MDSLSNDHQMFWQRRHLTAGLLLRHALLSSGKKFKSLWGWNNNPDRYSCRVYDKAMRGDERLQSLSVVNCTEIVPLQLAKKRMNDLLLSLATGPAQYIDEN